MPSPSSSPEPLPLDERLLGVTLLSVAQVAALWGCSRQTVYAMLQRGELRTVKLGADQRIPATELAAWIARRLPMYPSAGAQARRPEPQPLRHRP